MDPGGALEAARHTAVALDSTDGEASHSPARIPSRIRRRFLECRSTSPASVAEIDAKLRDANLRRQQFHEWLSSKARPKPRSPSWSSEGDYPGQRLEAKLVAAEQKRLSLLANSQMRLARLDEIRQAAKSGAKMRFQKEREELGTRVESRVQQAKENRMRLLKTHMQRRAAIQERSARSLLQRINQENRYKECVRSAIFQKRTAAEKKRMVLLEEEKKRAHARVVQARRIAKTVCHQRETERRRMKEQLENRLQKAKRQRAEFLKQRGSPRNYARINFMRHGEHLSRQLSRCWRRFMTFRRTTFALAKVYDALGLNVKSVKHMPFEQVALLIESITTLQTAKTLLQRLETRSSLLLLSDSSNLENIDHLLKRVASPNKIVSINRTGRRRVGKERVGVSESIISETKTSRYPVRLVLCAYMILGHPNAVFSGQGEREVALRDSAINFIQQFELLVKIILNGPRTAHSLRQSTPSDTPLDSHNESSSDLPLERSFRCQLRLFDSAWCSYLYRFVVWKVKDARSLEEDLVRAACQLELSMMQTCKMTAEGLTFDLSHDMKAIQKQVIEDQKLLREKVIHLSGNAGIERMECALSDARSKFFEAKGNSSPSANPAAHSLSPSVPHSLAKQMDSMPYASNIAEEEGSKHVAQSLFGVSFSPPLNFGSEVQNIDIRSSSSRGKQLSTENELLVNEIMHWGHGPFADDIDMVQAEEIRIQVKETMERAFWDGILDSLKKDIPDYNRLLGLVKEVRDELCDLAPQSWKQDILNSIDLDILSQVLESGLQDTKYLGNVLEYVLVVLQKLSAPTREEAMRKEHLKLLTSLADITQSNDKLTQSFVIAAIKGLRFVLDEIQTLKTEVSLARIKLMEPIIKGSAGLEYLQNSFTNRYGSPLDAADTLPQTIQWLSLISNNLEEEWNDHIHSCSVFSASHGVPVATLRTGASLSTSSKRKEGGAELPECSGAKVDKLVRIGLLNLVTAIEGVTPESVPETLKLNVSRLRNVQSQFQQIIVIATSILVLRQVLSEKSIASSELEVVVSNTVRRLCELLKSSVDVGIQEITAIMMNSCSSYSADSSSETKLQSSKEMIARMLSKSLQNDDAVFRMVSRSSYLALRAVVLGGCGSKGRKLADAALRRIGAGMLLEEVVDAGRSLIMMAMVTSRVHGPWYNVLL